MKLVKLVVSRFLCIESAEVEFGPGLNVLYGPNDLGKTSLAWALRAVLLLPHGSSQHERFVSWYSPGEPPKVQLTFTDGDNRYWRLTKTFSSGAIGRSSLEQSKDGRTFTAAASGREVDERVRQMLGWGISGVGGKAKTKGFPNTFLTQVLLAEQDNVRDILFKSSLSDDPDTSGRLRLTAALGALAQDPRFKKVLDEAQEQTDKAFTPGGRQKKSADSPFITLLNRIADLNGEKDEIELRVRETVATEDRIRELSAERDGHRRMLEECHADHRTSLARFELLQERRRIQDELDGHREALRSTEVLEHEIAASKGQLLELEAELEASESRVQDAKAAVVNAEQAAQDAARDEDLGHLDPTAANKRAALDAQLAGATSGALDAKQEHERAAAALATAVELAKTVSISRAEVAARRKTLARAEEDVRAALTAVTSTGSHLAIARDSLRDATSDDQAKARELRRAELENRTLTLESERPALAIMTRDIAEAKALASRLTASEQQGEALTNALAASTAARTMVEQRLSEHDIAVAELAELEQYGRLVHLRGVVERAAAANRGIELARAKALVLRARADEERTKVRSELPSSLTISELRKTRESLRIAEAKLGGGVTVVVRPRRAVELRVTHDGVTDAPSNGVAPVVVSADRTVSLQVADLLDVEITAGEEVVRKEAATLRAQWDAVGASLLRRHAVETVEELESVASASERAAREAERFEAEAQLAERSSPPAIDASAETAEAAQLGLALANADLARLGARFEQLGTAWQAAIKAAKERIDQNRSTDRSALDGHRTDMTKLETQLAASSEAREQHHRELHQKLSAHAEPLAQIEQRCSARLSELEREISLLAKQKDSLVAGATDAEAAARTRVGQLEGQLETETRAHKRLEEVAAKARDVFIQEQTRFEAAEARARTHDSAGAWAAALAKSAELQTTAWSEALGRARVESDVRQTAVTQLKQAIEASVRSQAGLVEHARERRRSTEVSAGVARRSFDTMNEADKDLKESRASTQVAIAGLQAKLALSRPDSAKTHIEALQVKLAALGAIGESIGQHDLDALATKLELLEQKVAGMNDDLLRLQIELQHVGGAVVRERRDELAKSLELATQQQLELTIEYDAWKLLVETLQASETNQGTHLGSQLAGPVSRRFRDLTGGRYGAIEMGAQLESEGLQVAGEVQQFGALSAGTQDQLATLLRLCIAEQIKSSIVLDDHLSQSDPVKVRWFNAALRSAASQIQVVLITCRPHEHLADVELPAEGEAVRLAAAGFLRAVDMTKIIRRFAPSPT